MRMQRYGPMIFSLLVLVILTLSISTPASAGNQCAATAVTTISSVLSDNAVFTSNTPATRVGEFIGTVPPKDIAGVSDAMDLDRTEYTTVDSRHYGGNLRQHVQNNYTSNSIIPAIARISFADIPQMQRI